MSFNARNCFEYRNYKNGKKVFIVAFAVECKLSKEWNTKISNVTHFQIISLCISFGFIFVCVALLISFTNWTVFGRIVQNTRDRWKTEYEIEKESTLNYRCATNVTYSSVFIFFSKFKWLRHRKESINFKLNKLKIIFDDENRFKLHRQSVVPTNKYWKYNDLCCRRNEFFGMNKSCKTISISSDFSNTSIFKLSTILVMSV